MSFYDMFVDSQLEGKMKTVLIIIIIIVAIAAYYYFEFVSKPGKETEKAKTSPEPAGGLVETLTGKTSVDQFQRARKKIDKVNKMRKDQFAEHGLGR